MSNPFYTWDGSAWSGVAYDVIPDSVDYQWSGPTFQTGDSAWTDDVQSQDMALTGDHQAVTLNNGEEAVEGDGIDDHGTAPIPSSYCDNATWEFELETTDSDDLDRLFGNRNSSDQWIYASLNTDAAFNVDDGNISFHLRGPNDAGLDVAPSGDPNLNDGSVHRVSIDIIDAANNDIDIIIDGVTQSLSFTDTNGPSSFESWEQDMVFWAWNNEGTVGSNLNAAYNKIRIHGSSVGQTI